MLRVRKQGHKKHRFLTAAKQTYKTSDSISACLQSKHTSDFWSLIGAQKQLPKKLGFLTQQEGTNNGKGVVAFNSKTCLVFGSILGAICEATRGASNRDCLI